MLQSPMHGDAVLAHLHPFPGSQGILQRVDDLELNVKEQGVC